MAVAYKKTASRLGEHLGNRADLDLTSYYNSTQGRNRSGSCIESSTKRSWSKSSPLEGEKISWSIRKPSSG